jgi:predicted nuclease of predicted toxin-antitoxin system
VKLLVDECLSEELAKLAQRRGHPEASHVAWIGKRGWKDWELKAVILNGDWTFVTKNSIESSAASRPTNRTTRTN